MERNLLMRGACARRSRFMKSQNFEFLRAKRAASSPTSAGSRRRYARSDPRARS